MAAKLLFGSLLFPNGVLASTLYSEKENLVRREPLRSVHMSPAAEFVRARPTAAEVAKSSEGNPGQCETLQCEKKDYLFGQEKMNACRHPDKEFQVMDSDMCRYAAARAHAHIDPPETFFLREAQWQIIHPRGCFHKKCVPAGSPEGTPEIDCYFHNEAAGTVSDPSHANFGEDPETGAISTPICYRELYEDGVENSTADDGGCPDEYSVIKDFNRCHFMCGLQDYNCHGQFEIGLDNFTRHHDFPEGCFHMLEAGSGGLQHLFYNSISRAGHHGTTVTGTPECMVTSSMAFDESNAANTDNSITHRETMNHVNHQAVSDETHHVHDSTQPADSQA